MQHAALLGRPELERVARALRERPGALLAVDGPARRAAVALILRPRAEGELEMLLIKRAEWSGDPWSGHVAFPGGRQEPGDATLEGTAVRETYEETAIDLARDGSLLGTLDELRPRTPVEPPLIVRPYVFAAVPEVAIVPSPEVAEAFWVSLASLRDPAVSGETTVVVRGEERRVSSFLHGAHMVWGLTERAIRQFLAVIG